MNRRGITRVEVIALICAGLLVAIVLLPNINSSRINSRKLGCLNNIRTVGLALQNYASWNDSKLPFLSQSLKVQNNAGEEGELIASWAVVLLPAIDASSALKNIRQNADIKDGLARMRDEEKVFLPVFTCPDDDDSFRKAGAISYVVNAGCIEQSLYHSDPDRKHIPGTLAWIGELGGEQAIPVHASTGVFWQTTGSIEPSLESILTGDGASMTLMLTENLQAGHWYDTDTAKISFGFPVTNIKGQVPLGSGHVFESTQKPLNTQFAGGTLTSAKPQNWRVNAELNSKKGTLPRPSSNHVGGVNVILCDSSGKFLNENIDPHVYLKLLTSNGATYGEGKLQEGSY